MSIEKDIKRELFVFSTVDYYSLKEYFEERARNGWLIDKIKFNIAIYKRIEPTNLNFLVDVYPNIYKTIAKEDIKSYKSLYEDAGWSHAISSNNLHIFYSKKEDNLLSVQTQEEINQRIVEKPLRPELMGMILNTLSVVLYLSIYFPYDYDNLFSNISMVMPFCLPLLFLNGVASAAKDLFWFIRAKKNIKTNKPLPKTNLKMSKTLGAISFVFTYTLLIMIIIALVLDLTINASRIAFLIVPLILVPIISITYNKEVKSLEISKIIKISKVLLISFAGVILFAFTILIVSRVSSSNNEDLKPGYIGLTHEDFNSKINPEHKYFDRDGSILVPKYSSYKESSRLMGLETVSIETRGSKIARYIFDEKINDELYNKRVQWNRVLKDASNEYTGYEEAYYIENPNSNIKNNSLILLKDNKILFIFTDLDLSQTKYINIIEDKIK